MATVSPFRALHYNPHKIPDLSQVITPPYDVIPPGDDVKYWNRSPYNFAHVDLPRAKEDDYHEANHCLTRWRELGLLVQDAMPSYYLYRQDFTLDGRPHTRDTLMATVLLHEFSEGVIRPHENTFGKHKKDRLQLTRQTKCQLSPIFGVAKDPEGILKTSFERWAYGTPVFATIDEAGVRHTLWRMEGTRAPEISEFFEDRSIYIVDGHHRYESAVAYAKELGVLGRQDHPAASQLFAIGNVYDPGLVVLPTHRLVRGVDREKLSRDAIAKSYDIAPMSFEQLKHFVDHPCNTPSFAVSLFGDLFLLTPHDWSSAEMDLGKSLHRLPVVWSDRRFLPNFCGITEENRAQRVSYEKDLSEAWSQRSTTDVIVFHAPPRMEQITHVADDKGFMPQKSTYFYPKLAAGIVLRDVSG